MKRCGSPFRLRYVCWDVLALGVIGGYLFVARLPLGVRSFIGLILLAMAVLLGSIWGFK